jgi:hypothetical protein
MPHPRHEPSSAFALAAIFACTWGLVLAAVIAVLVAR